MHTRKRVDPRVIGSFVVGAVILSVAGLLFFGPGGFLSETRSYVIYFDSSVKGLNVGSPVRFRGVKIGQVKEINVRVRPSDFAFNIPVVIEIEPSRIKAEGTKQGLLDALKTTVQGEDPMISLVDKGLRAQLQLDSLVTGQLYVNFDMIPEAPLILTENTSDYPELPSISSSLEELTKTFEDLPLKELAQKMIRSAEGFEKIITSPDLHNALAQFDDTTTQLNQLLKNLNQQLLPLAATLRETLSTSHQAVSRLEGKIDPVAEHFEDTLNQVQKTIRHIDAKIDPLSEQVNQTLHNFNGTALKAGAAITQINNLSASDSHLLEQLSTTLQEVNRTARSLGLLSAEIERDPQMLIRGRIKGDE
ncbi:MAG: MCE family protein [Desulfuromonadales bacterium]|nr:MCE family protein [Desulfuromonadales bacterium]MBN2793433.1 MCE family protein [Desulfuromonadales bacterium]